ncbi:MAG: fluoride efflux transporter CrcB [Bacteroidota bacterium]|nr:fluoride efflux transporter CrcB [Bacteroidota bacterium]
MRTYIYVMLGGAVGSLLRFLVGKLLPAFNMNTWPWPTFSVNIIGCFLAGLAASYLKKQGLPNDWSLILITGFMGGFTTFSAFSLEILQYIQNDKWAVAVLYIFLSVVLSIGAVMGGWCIGSK